MPATEEERFIWFMATANHAEMSHVIAGLEAHPGFRGRVALDFLNAMRRHRDSLPV